MANSRVMQHPMAHMQLFSPQQNLLDMNLSMNMGSKVNKTNNLNMDMSRLIPNTFSPSMAHQPVVMMYNPESQAYHLVPAGVFMASQGQQINAKGQPSASNHPFVCPPILPCQMDALSGFHLDSASSALTVDHMGQNCSGIGSSSSSSSSHGCEKMGQSLPAWSPHSAPASASASASPQLKGNLGGEGEEPVQMSLLTANGTGGALLLDGERGSSCSSVGGNHSAAAGSFSLAEIFAEMEDGAAMSPGGIPCVASSPSTPLDPCPPTPQENTADRGDDEGKGRKRKAEGVTVDRSLLEASGACRKKGSRAAGRSRKGVEEEEEEEEEVKGGRSRQSPEHILRKAFEVAMAAKAREKEREGLAAARKGPCTEPQALAARARRERVNARMRTLQNLIPGAQELTTECFLVEAANHITDLLAQINVGVQEKVASEALVCGLEGTAMVSGWPQQSELFGRGIRVIPTSVVQLVASNGGPLDKVLEQLSVQEKEDQEKEDAMFFDDDFDM